MKDDMVYALRGVDRARSRDYLGAIDDATEALRINPQYEDAYLLRGVTRELQRGLRSLTLRSEIRTKAGSSRRAELGHRRPVR